jgi:alcohol dehydrogenase class IV
VRPGLPTISIPTTAGSGAEATHFAVVYVGTVKHSVAHCHMLPTVALVDPDLTYSLPPLITAVTGLDAFAQAVESYWSVQSTPESRADASRAVRLVLEHFVTAVKAPTPQARHAMSTAAYLAGRAINRTKTTGAHAMAYPLTAMFGVPHGHAVSLTLGALLVYNSQVTDEDVADSRGAAHVREAIAELLALLGCRTPEEGRVRIAGLMREVGVATTLSELRIRRHRDIEHVVGNVNAERMGNNPRLMTDASVRTLLQSVC